MDDNLGELFRGVEKSPTYWMQVALLEFLQSLDAMSASRRVFTKKELAKLVGVSAPTLSRWLNGQENLTISTMCRLATALGAAVHIHVADYTKKGRWKEELGEWETKQREFQELGGSLPKSPIDSASGRPVVVSLAEHRQILKSRAQEASMTMTYESPLEQNHG